MMHVLKDFVNYNDLQKTINKTKPKIKNYSIGGYGKLKYK